MSEPTLSEQITAVDCASPWTPEHREALDAAARTLRLISNHAAVDETLRQIVDLELMQAQEQSKGGDSTENVNRSGNRLATDANAVAGDAHPHKHAQAADPPPPEDALLAQDRAAIEWEIKANPNERTREVIGLLLAAYDAARDRIAADAEEIAAWSEHVNRQLNPRIAAAEARAQGLEADARRYRWLRDHCKDTDIRAGLGWLGQDIGIDSAIDTALAQSPDSGKERGDG